jgi:hypothetical protein
MPRPTVAQSAGRALVLLLQNNELPYNARRALEELQKHELTMGDEPDGQSNGEWMLKERPPRSCADCPNPLEAGQQALCLVCSGARWEKENPEAARRLADAQEELADQLERMGENQNL